MESYYLNDEAENGCLTRIDMNIPKTEVEQFEMLDGNNAKKPCKLRRNGDRTIICDFDSFPMNNDVHDIPTIKVKSSCERHIAGLTKSLERILSCTTELLGSELNDELKYSTVKHYHDNQKVDVQCYRKCS
jgi:hypothetical protein